MLERTQPGAGATAKSFAWINAGFWNDALSYHRLKCLGIDAYRILERDLAGALKINWGGSVQWQSVPARATRLRDQVRAHQQWGYPTQLVDEAGLRRLEPQLAPGPLLAAAHCDQEASVDPLHAVEVLTSRARALGAAVVYPADVTALDIRSGRVRGVRTASAQFDADVVVLAAGVDTAAVASLADLRVPLENRSGLLAHTTPRTPPIGRVVVSPTVSLIPRHDGRTVAAARFANAAMEPSREMGERMLEDAQRYLPSAGRLELDRVTLGWQAEPSDGHPILGFSNEGSDVYLAVTGSGVTLAPIIGRLAALEILDGVRVEMLEPYRLSRFV